MNKRAIKILIFSFAVIFSVGIYVFIMVGLKDFNDPLGTNSNELRPKENSDSNRVIIDGNETIYDYLFIWLNETSAKEIGRAVGHFIWETRTIDIIIIGIALFVASESAGTMIKGIDDQCTEFRKELCETDKFILMEKKEECAEDVEEEK